MIKTKVQHKNTFRHGIFPEHNKSGTDDLAIRRLAFAPELALPLLQSGGKPALPIVHEDQEVVRGEPIAEPSGFISVPVHAPATGMVSRIDWAPNPRGEMVQAIYIKPNPASRQEVLYGAPRDVDALSPKEIIQAVQDSGMVGFGGAAFPTHAKMKSRDGNPFETLVVNGCECEPWLTSDHRVMVEEPEHILLGLRLVMRAVRVHHAIIAIEDNKPDAVAVLERQCAKVRWADIEVRVLPAKYPQGAKKMLAAALFGKEVPSGAPSSSVGMAIFNVSTLAKIGELLPKQEGLIERVITVTGPGVARPGNYLIPFGTPLHFLLKEVGIDADVNRIILGGPMMGKAASSLDMPITKDVTGIIALTHNYKGVDQAFKEMMQWEKTEQVYTGTGQIYPCIRCGSCLDACPMILNPSRLGRLAERRRYQEMEESFHLNDCIECGCCSYVCPSNIPLIHHFRVAKGMNWERKYREAQQSKEDV